MTHRRIPGRGRVPIRVLVPLVLIVVSAAIAAVSLAVLDRRAGSPQHAALSSHVSQPNGASTPSASSTFGAFDKSRYSTTDPASLWVVVNKSHPMSPIDYAPADIVTIHGRPVSARMKNDLDALFAQATNDGIGLTLASGYRSYDYQKNLYGSYVAADGQEKADTYSARPGYSEHQTGLAVDFGDTAGRCIVEDCYADTPEAKWLAANAYKYGFLLRYTADDQRATGYQAEAWHYRYIGRDLANVMHAQNISTLEQFFNVSGGASYE